MGSGANNTFPAEIPESRASLFPLGFQCSPERRERRERELSALALLETNLAKSLESNSRKMVQPGRGEKEGEKGRRAEENILHPREEKRESFYSILFNPGDREGLRE